MTNGGVPIPSRTPDTERWAGIVFAFLSTFLYAISHVSLRYLTKNYAEVDHNWIIFYKETIGLLILLPWLLLRLGQGRFRYTSLRLIFCIFLAALLCQIIGSRFQVLGYAVIGLVITVPLIQSSMLLGVALLGHFVFGDSLSRRRKIAITILIVAVAILSIGKEMTVGQTPEQETVGTGLFLLVAAGAVAAGIAFAIYLVMLRYAIRQYWADDNSTWLSFRFRHWIGYDHVKQPGERFYSPFPVSLAMAIVLAVGTVFFGILLYDKSGVAAFYDAPQVAWYCIVISGVCNLTGFIFQVQGLRMTSAVQASLIAVSQIMLLSLIGLLCFGEVIDKYGLVIIGLGLTVYGVFMSAKPEVSKS
jgi:drug/metabolite transporter (DMT)-like permease